MRRFRRPFALAVGVAGATLIVLGLVVEPSFGATSGGLSYPPGSIESVPDVSDNGDGVTGGSVPCPNSHPNPTGGGAETFGSDPSFDIELKSTSPGALNDDWHVQANNSSGNPAQMTMYAICSKGRFSYPSTQAIIPPGDVNFAKARCPAGTKVTGGGLRTIGGDHSVEVSSSVPADGRDSDHKPNDAWFGVATNGTGANVRMEVDAVCAKRGHYKVVEGPTGVLPDNSSLASTVTCPGDGVVTGGGLDISGHSTDFETASSFPIDGGDNDAIPDDAWSATAYNDSSGSTTHTQTFAVCKITKVHFSGNFTEGGTVQFVLANRGTQIQDWRWAHMPVTCKEGPDENSSHYRISVAVHHHHFHAGNVHSPEGFTTTLDGTLTNHDTEASGTLTMSGPEPPTGTHCHGTGHWTATVD